VMLRGRIVGEENGGVALDDAYQAKMGLIR
jgi:hypothetical protein